VEKKKWKVQQEKDERGTIREKRISVERRIRL
jgi:hypothetical protein